MSTHDYIVDNQNGANFRSDLNNALAAIVSNNSSATAPTTTYAFMLWADTANDLLKQRNAADSAWISILTLSTGAPLGTLSSSLLSGALPAIDGSALTGVGKVLQIVHVQDGANATTTTIMPKDTTIPQNTEGAEFITLAITPTSATSKLKIDVVLACETNDAAFAVVGLFKDSAAGAIAVNSEYTNASTIYTSVIINHVITAGSTSAQTFKVRAGRYNAGTLRINGGLFGGLTSSTITITEYEV